MICRPESDVLTEQKTERENGGENLEASSSSSKFLQRFKAGNFSIIANKRTEGRFELVCPKPMLVFLLLKCH
jgi:hypothetical protein